MVAVILQYCHNMQMIIINTDWFNQINIFKPKYIWYYHFYDSIVWHCENVQ